MSGKINLCGIQFDYQKLVHGIMNMNINICNNNNFQEDTSVKMDYDYDTHITKEYLDKQLDEYMNQNNYKNNIDNNHKYCQFKCLNMEDWKNHSLDDYIKHQEECEQRYMDLFVNGNVDLIFHKIDSDLSIWHPKYFLKINDDKINYYADLLGLNSV